MPITIFTQAIIVSTSSCTTGRFCAKRIKINCKQFFKGIGDTRTNKKVIKSNKKRSNKKANIISLERWCWFYPVFSFDTYFFRK